MQRILRTILALCPLLLASCEKEDASREKPRLQVDAPAEIRFTAEGGSPDATVTVECDVAWRVRLEPEDGNGWLWLGERTETLFTLEAAVNTRPVAPLSVEVHVEAANIDPVVISVWQEAAAETQTTQIEIEGVSDGTEFTLLYTNNLRTSGMLTEGRLEVAMLGGSSHTIYGILSPRTDPVIVGREQSEPIRLAYASDGKPIFRTDGQGRRLVNTFSELLAVGQDATSLKENYLQESDIDMLGSESLEGRPDVRRQNWKPLGHRKPFDLETAPDPDAMFSGRYDGGGHRLVNMRMEDADNLALFGGIGPQGVVTSLTLASGTVRGEIFCGGICCYNFGTVEQCHSSLSITAQSRAGGICGYNAPGATLRACGNEGPLCGDIALGGICGMNEGLIWGCDNRGAITGDSAAEIGGGNLGGICGSNDSELRECRNYGEVSGFYDIGGICGNSSGLSGVRKVIVTGCFNEGLITGRPQRGEQSQNVGGIVGENNHATLSASANAGTIVGELYVGGVNGYNWGEIVATYNVGTISGYGYVAGVSGYIASDESNPGVLRASYNRGIVSAALPAYAASICSFNYGSILGCYYLKYGSEEAVNYSKQEGNAQIAAFGEGVWPGASDADWKTGNLAPEGRYWKSLGAWNAAGDPTGASSDFPTLWWETE